MAQRARDSNLTRTARLKLKRGDRYYRRINSSVALVYRRTQADGFGTWSAKITLPDGRREQRRLGDADDHQDANGVDVLSFEQAQTAALKRAEELKRAAGVSGDYIVEDAGLAYLEWFREHRKGVRETENVLNTHIKPDLGAILLRELTSRDIKAWHERLAAAPAKLRTGKFAKTANRRAAPQTADEKRARKATANRILTVLKAILNRAYQDKRVAEDSEWRRVKPFRKVDEPRVRFLSDAEAVRLSNACPPDLRKLVQGALLTGARLGELAALRVQDVDINNEVVYVAESKSGRPRHIPLNPEGVALFSAAILGKTGEKAVFTRADGAPWGKNHHVRAFLAANAAAKISPPVAFHELRHTYASHLAQAGVDLLTIAKLLGHSDTRITSRHYAHLSDKTLAAAVTKLPSFASTANPLQAVPTRIEAA